MELEIFAARRDALREKIAGAGLDALLVSYAANRYYLSGFELHDGQCNESNGWLLVTAEGTDWLMTDPRYDDAAKRVWAEDNLFIYTAPKEKQVADFLASKCSGPMGFDPTGMCWKAHQSLKDKLDLRPSPNLVEELRLFKDPAEIEAMRVSCALNHKVFKQLETVLVPGMTEYQAAWEVEKLFREQGASELAFSTIVGVNENAALPHARPGETVIKDNCLVLVDMGARLSGYNSDQTRTFWIGDEPSQRFLDVRAWVQEAQQAALDIIRPGLPIREAYFAARKCFEKRGVADRFTHALGHGIGLETHERPSLGPKAEGVFEPGMMVTVEPGLYWPDWGGIRWEFMTHVTDDGCEIL